MTLSNEELKALYDAECKKVLAEKGIIAHILKACVMEYSSVNVDDIARKYIQGKPEVSKIRIQPTTGRMRIESQHTEDKSESEGTVFFDIRFTALVPNTKRPIELIINIEAQNKFNPGYPLLKRGIYYCSRMISSQYGTIFTKSDYGKIKKVYSIWVCTHPTKKWEYTITRYSMQENNIIGSAKAKPTHYDLLSVVMICLGKKQYTKLTGLLRLLNLLLLDNKLSEGQKQAKLSNEFSIKMTPGLERGVKKMCNLSEGIEERGIKRGIKQGRREGHREGHREGQQEERLASIRNLMETLNFDAQQAMNALKIPEKEQARYASMI